MILPKANTIVIVEGVCPTEVSIPHGESFLALGFATLCSTHCSPINTPTQLLMDIPSVKTGQQLYI